MGRKSWVDSNVCRGKLRKHKPPSRWQKKGEAKEGATKTCSLEGSRIINLEQLATFIGDVSAHSQSCQGTVSLTGERYREGLASVLSASCNSCRLEVAFPTSSKVTGLGGGQR